MNVLQPGTLLQNGKYKILSKLGQGGFGITYLAENTLLDDKVAIKEFFFKEYCDREDTTSHVTIPTSGNRPMVERFKQKFLKEARTIYKLKHPNIVELRDVFEENDTAYYVMEFIEGESLADMVKRRGAIPEAEAMGYVLDAAEALKYIHSRNINHLDIKPGNLIRRRSDGKVLVIDFGVAKQYDEATNEGTTTTPVCISAGYSPAEQYLKNGVQNFSPESDVYALAATLYKLLSGVTPPEAMAVQDDGLPMDELIGKGVSKPVCLAIAMAMKGKRQRTPSVEKFIDSLKGNLHQPKPKPQSKPNSKPQPNKNRLWLICAAVAVAAAVGMAVALSKSGDGVPDSTGSQETATVSQGPVSVINETIVLTKGHESKRNFVYSGTVDAAGLPHGKGEAQYPETKSSGSADFKGTFEHGITKEGVMNFKNGTKYSGTFNAEGYYAEGIWTEKDGYYFKGTFKDGNPYNGNWYTKDGQFDAKIVNGKGA